MQDKQKTIFSMIIEVFTTNVAPQCRAFSMALEIEKLKDPLFRSPEGTGDTNDWCIAPEFSGITFEQF